MGMKNRFKIGCLVLLFLIALSSCTNENVALTHVQLLSKIVEVSADGSSNTTLLTYNGNKIVSIDKVDAFLTFYYTNDLITKITELDKSNQQLSTLQYSYTNGDLTKITSSDNYVLNYIHNTDGTISYEKLTKDSNNNDVKIYHGTLYFQSGNLIKDDKFMDDAGTGILSEKTISISYDAKNNALHNILGFNKLFDYSKMISANNDISNTITSDIKHTDDDQETSSITMNSSTYQYDTNDYPTEIISQNILFGGNDSNHVKSQLFYN
jgi:hypothetical protein